ncbi:MAG: L,D-transpeptidase family protein [Bacteroides sp.]|nr:L,D-transpeptidase family protein [Bacteroides sp.]MCM1413659.1 L,D-transpeptidase family protein [Bacteroides sp.]MCM1471838.1 L,D-transpeptidase family protein [Bacteroides sp.]
MKNLSTFLAIAFLNVILMSSCGGNSNEGDAVLDATAENDTIISEIAALDTATAIVDSAAEKKDDKLTPLNLPEFASDQEAIDWMQNSADAEKYSSGILIKMASDNLEYCNKLLRNPYDYFVVVDKPSMYVVLFDRYGREKQSYRMACGRNYGTKHKRSDCRTPEGFFSAEGIYDSTDWLYTDDNGYTSPTRGVYGTRFIRVENPATRTVGIHGTNAPGSLGRRASHGCIRVHNNSIIDLVKYVKKGMPIIVNPSDRDQQVNKSEGYTVGRINIGKPAITEPIKSEEKKDTVKTETAVSDTVKTATPVDTVETEVVEVADSTFFE